MSYLRRDDVESKFDVYSAVNFPYRVNRPVIEINADSSVLSDGAVFDITEAHRNKLLFSLGCSCADETAQNNFNSCLLRALVIIPKSVKILQIEDQCTAARRLINLKQFLIDNTTIEHLILEVQNNENLLTVCEGIAENKYLKSVVLTHCTFLGPHIDILQKNKCLQVICDPEGTSENLRNRIKDICERNILAKWLGSLAALERIIDPIDLKINISRFITYPKVYLDFKSKA